MTPRPNAQSMDLDDLWRLHVELTKILAENITGGKLELDKRLAQLGRTEQFGKVARLEAKADWPRRKYKVLPSCLVAASAPDTSWKTS